MRIVYCLNSIRYLGGIQRVTIVKANALADISDNEVYIIVSDNRGGRIVHPLSPKVHLIDLDVNYYQDDWKSKWHVLKGIVVKRREHKKKLAKVLHEINPDIVISVGQSEKNMIPAISGRWVKVRELHFTKNYRWFHAHSIFSKTLAIFGELYDYFYKIRQYDRIIVLTYEDKESHWKGYKNVSVIPNPISFSDIAANNTLEGKKVIAIGRLSALKNFSSLIRSYRIVAQKHPDWILEIYGDGEQKYNLLQLIEQFDLRKQVYLRGFTSEVQRELLNASCFVLSSDFEGLPLVMLEAMSCGLPVVSYACPCGPKDIISEGVDGFLVPVNDEQGLADRICRLIENEEMRKAMGKAARLKAEQYRIEKIIPMWMDLFNQLLKEKREK
ncbi:MAG: glycosyltransferase family 4 protein [Parabacteroides sp.]|nr:glycosyltransferase family 4 protein [Parabacteroides sp.]